MTAAQLGRSWLCGGLLLLLPLRLWGQEPGEAWLTPHRAAEVVWGAEERPPEALPRPRSLYLPDSGFIGRSASDHPEDLEVPAPPGERRVLRYIDGVLVDAWLMRDGPINTAAFESYGQPDWAGVVLGPAEPGWRALGYARSWTLPSGRTALHWADSFSATEVLATRAPPSAHYGVHRAAPVDQGHHPSPRKVRLSGPLKKAVKAHAAAISGCLDPAPKPVEVTVHLRYDGVGRPARLRVETDQPSFHVMECIAGAIATTRAPALTEAFFVATRSR